MEAAISDHKALHFRDKVLSFVAWGVGIGVLASVGWMVLEPRDPHGAVCLATADGALLTLLQVLALSAVVSGLATVLIGRKLPDAGVFAVSLGLAVAALRGATTSYLLINVAGADAAARSTLAWKLAFEGLIWFLPILVAMVVGGVVLRWSTDQNDGAESALCHDMSLADLPLLRDLLPQQQDRPAATTGLQVTLVSLVVAALLFRLFATGTPEQSVRHGQSYFALVVAFYIGGLIAYRYLPAGSALWGCLSVPLLCLLGYILAALSSPPAGYDQLASVPPGIFYRALPIEYLSVGSAAAVAAFWTTRK